MYENVAKMILETLFDIYNRFIEKIDTKKTKAKLIYQWLMMNGIRRTMYCRLQFKDF